MTIVFQNPGLIDLRAVQIMGINAKETKNPIGQFGTGLKYAIAVLLRNNCQVMIYRGEQLHKFFCKKDNFRGKEFDFVHMANSPCEKDEITLGFTLELGKHWEAWMAIRELESNCRDEGGKSFSNTDYQLSPDTTTIVISGATADEAYSKLGDIFIQTKPLWACDTLEIHQIENPEQEGWVYYRGVRCGKQEKSMAFRYNIMRELSLTEDRTFRYSWDGTYHLPDLGKCDKPEIIKALMAVGLNSVEYDIQYSEYRLSPEFIEIVQNLGTRATPKAWAAVRVKQGLAEFTDIPMDDLQKRMLTKAKSFITAMGEPRVNDFPIFMSNDLGEKVLGRAHIVRKEIWIAQRTFEMGMKQLVSTLYEEYIHLDRKYNDLDYEMQNFLFDTIITQAAKLQGEIL